MRRLLIAASLALSLIALPCAGTASDPYEIDAILPQTGSGAFLGKTEAAALGVVENLVNGRGGIKGRSIHFAVLDDQSNPQVGVQLTNYVLSRKGPVIIGSTLAAICNAQAPIAKDGPVIYCLSPGVHPPQGSYMFTAGVSTTDQLAASIRYIRERGWTKVALITSTDATGQDADQNIATVFAAPENGTEQIAAHEHFNTTDVSVAAQMAHIKSSGAQALVIWSTGTPLGTLLRGAAEAGLDIPVLASPGNLTYAQMKAYASILPHEIYFPGSAGYAPNVLPNRSAVKQAVDAFKAAGIRPDQGYFFTWDPALIVVEALEKLGFDATPAQIRQFIASYHSVGIDGQFDFVGIPQRGVGIDSIIIVRWDPAKDTWVGVSKSGGRL
jgi:branched-chain amino acid transport system substrate-binding protein